MGVNVYQNCDWHVRATSGHIDLIWPGSRNPATCFRLPAVKKTWEWQVQVQLGEAALLEGVELPPGDDHDDDGDEEKMILINFLSNETVFVMLKISTVNTSFPDNDIFTLILDCSSWKPSSTFGEQTTVKY